jgi:hypothetical protein
MMTVDRDNFREKLFWDKSIREGGDLEWEQKPRR